MRAGTLLRVRGEGGSEFDIEVPADGTPQREILDQQIEKNQVMVIDDPDADYIAPAADTPEKVAAAIVASLERLDDLDDDGQQTVDDLVKAARPDGAGSGEQGRPKVRDDIELWRTYRAGQGHQVDGLTKAELQKLPDTKEG